MRRGLKKLPIGLAAAAFALTATVSVGGAMGYFTTYSAASGGVTLNMGFTEIVPDEVIDGNKKIVTIKNIGDYDCFVRARAFSVQELKYEPGEGWSKGDDGYYYYESVLGAGESTTALTVSITFPGDDEDRPDVDVIVVQEHTPVVYDDDGNPKADWNQAVTTETESDQEAG